MKAEDDADPPDDVAVTGQELNSIWTRHRTRPGTTVIAEIDT
jgi:hypothetical protein